MTIHLTTKNKTSGEMTVNNVVAEIRGREPPDEWILIGARLDSWDFGTGAGQGNGRGERAGSGAGVGGGGGVEATGLRAVRRGREQLDLIGGQLERKGNP